MENKRYDWIDIAKGFGILMVMLGHINWGVPHDLVYSCHLPLFFFLSGYVFNCTLPFGKFTLKKLKAILLPYFLLAIPMVYFIAVYEANRNMKMIPYIIIMFLTQNRMSTLWYLGALFILSFLAYAVLRLTHSTKSRWITILILTIIGLVYARLGGPTLPWNIDTAFCALPFFALGYELKLHQADFDRRYNDKSKKFKILSAVALLFINIIFNLLTRLIAHEGLEMYYSQYGLEPLTLISAFSGIFFICLLSKVVHFKAVRFIGRNSLIYFAWHQAIAIPVVEQLMNTADRKWLRIGASMPSWGRETIEYILVLIFMTIIVFIWIGIKKLIFKQKQNNIQALF